MNADDVLNEFRAAGALREGHFVLSSGLHSPVFLQKNLVFMHAVRADETGHQLGVPSIFVERDGGAFKLRRGFHLEPGARVATRRRPAARTRQPPDRGSRQPEAEGVSIRFRYPPGQYGSTGEAGEKPGRSADPSTAFRGPPPHLR